MSQWLDVYQDDEAGFVFDGAWLFSGERGVLLLGRNGHILLLDDVLAGRVARGDIGGNLLFRLLQRGFCRMKGEEKAEDEFDVLPVFFMVDFTNRCNMACRYCLRECDREKSVEKRISRETLEKLADFLADYCRQNDIPEISVQPWGGEPLLEKDKIFYLQDLLEARGVPARFVIETNGLLLTDGLLDELVRRNIFVSVSMDGNERIHDAQRVLLDGNASHRYVEAALLRLQKRFGDDTAVLATITRASAPYVGEILEYFGGLGIRRVKLNFVHQSSFVDNGELCLTPEEIGAATMRILETLVALGDRGIEIRDYNIYTKVRNLLLAEKSDVCLCRGCNGGKKMITVDGGGNLFPCDVSDYPEEKIGNIDTAADLVHTVKEARQSKPYFTRKTSRRCGKCPWYYFCRGGCTVHVKCAGKEPGDIDDIECAVNWALYPELVRLILSEPEKINRLAGEEILM